MQSVLDYPLVYTQHVAWGDMDAFGHVNNVMYYRYVESARLAYIEHTGILSADVLTVVASNQCKLPTVLETLYRLPRNILIVQIAFLVLEPLVPVVRFLKHLKRVTIQMSLLYQQRWFRHRLRLR